jgi:mannose-1-phosphate guanylyltransferase
MLQATVRRLDPLIAPDKVYVVTGPEHVAEVARQIAQTPADQFIVEPSPRGTGPAIGLAVAIIAQRYPDAIVGSFAADHLVKDEERFRATIAAAAEVAAQGFLVTVGIEPRYPETGYGYIELGETLGDYGGIESFAAASFKEKPDAATADAYVKSGRYLWNASMFVWRAATFMEETESYLPQLAGALREIALDWNTPRREETLAAVWPSIESVTIDEGIFERSRRVAVVPGRFSWSDIGDWNALSDILPSDARGNIIRNADVVSVGAAGAVVFGTGRTVALVGVSDIVVVDTPDAILVCERSQAQRVREIVDQLRSRGSTDLI